MNSESESNKILLPHLSFLNAVVMSSKQRIMALQREIRSIQNQPVSQFESYEAKSSILEELKRQLDSLTIELAMSSRTLDNKTIYIKRYQSMLEFNVKTSSAIDFIRSSNVQLMRRMFPHKTSVVTTTFEDFDILKADLRKIKNVIDSVICLDDHETRIINSLSTLALSGHVCEQLNTKDFGFKEFSMTLDIIISSILKLRVEVVTDILLYGLGVVSPQDVSFNDKLGIPSIRTPDFIHDNGKEVMIMESNYSSRNAKGFYSKGIDYRSSKYYEEMYYIRTRLNKKIIYCPVIFFHTMTSEFGFDRLSNQFVENELPKTFHQTEREFSELDKLEIFFHVINRFSQFFPVTRGMRETLMSNLKLALKICELMNDEIYPFGKLMNKCFSYLNNVANIDETIDTEFGVKKIVEYNKGMLDRTLIQLNMRNTSYCLEYIFSGKRKNVDILRLKRSAINLFRKVKDLHMHDDFALEPVITRSLKSLTELISKKIGFDSFGKNNKKEKIQMFINYEEINRLYFDLVNLKESHLYLLDEFENDIKFVPHFRYIKDPLPPLSKHLLLKEEKVRISEGELSSINFSSSETHDLIISEIDSNLLIQSITKKIFIRIDSNQCDELIGTGSFPDCDIFCSELTINSLIVSILLDNFFVISDDRFIKPDGYDQVQLNSFTKRVVNLNNEKFNLLNSLIKSLENVKFFSKTDMCISLKDLDKQTQIDLDGSTLKLKKFIPSDKTFNELKTYLESKNINQFKSFNFDILKNNYLKEYVPKLSDKEILEKMINLISKQKLVTRKSRITDFETVYDQFPDGNLGKSENFGLSISVSVDNDIRDVIFESFEPLNTERFVRNFRSKINDDNKEIKYQGFTFTEKFISYKKMKFSYESDEVMKLISSLSKLTRSSKISQSVKEVIDKCNFKRAISKNTHEDKIFKPDILEIEDLSRIISEVSQINDDTQEFSLIEPTVMDLTDNKLLRSISEEYESVLNSSSYIKTAFRTSVLLESLLFEATKWKVREGEFLYSSENLKNVSYLILPSPKLTNDLTRIRYMLFMNTRSSEMDKYSIFKNKISNSTVRFTNVHEEDVEILSYRSRLFHNIYNLFFYYFRKGLLTADQLKEGFVSLHMFLFSLSTPTKKIISIFKYLNVITFADFSNLENLYEKYFVKNKLKNTLSFYFMKKICDSTEYNMNEIFKITRTSNGDLQPIRGLESIKINLKSLWCSVPTIKDLIEMNTFYNLVEKKTTNNFHSNTEFISTIIQNNNYLHQASDEGYDLNDLDDKMIDRSSTSLYCRESMYLGVKLLIQDILKERHILTTDNNEIISQFRRVVRTKLFDKEFFSATMTDRVYSRFSSTFLSSRKSMKIKREQKNGSVKQRMIESTLEYINLIFGSSDNISPVELFERTFAIVEENSLINGIPARDLSNLCVLAKKEQHEDDREIYILFIVTKILTVFIQSVFYVLNSIINGEMVVKPTIKKLELIKFMTSEIFKVSKADEIVFMNGDMASWSGRDVFKKFEFLTDCLYSTGYFDYDVMNMTKFAFMVTGKMKIVIPENCVNSDKYSKDHFRTENYFGKSFVEYEKSWPQGIFHNPSSFVHACEQRLKEEILISTMKKGTQHKYLDHSDDKNEIINLSLSDYENYVKISNYCPAFFSLKSSLTKDSFSRIVSEMVGLQNIRGKLFDNPIKTIRDISTRTNNPFFIINYKSSLSAISSFYDKSHDTISSDFYNVVSYSNLAKRFGVKMNITLILPIDYGGFMRLPFNRFSYHGRFIDIVDKFFIMKKYSLSISKLYELFPLEFRFLKDKNMRTILKKYKNLKKLDRLPFDIQEEKNKFVNNILRSQMSERIEMFRKRESFQDIMNIRNSSFNKLFMMIENAAIPISQKDPSELIEKIKVEGHISLNEDLIVDEEIIFSYKSYKSTMIREKESPTVDYDIRFMDNYSLHLVKINLGYSSITFENLKSIFEGKFDTVFKSFKNVKNKDSIFNEFETIRDHLHLYSPEDFLMKENIVKNFMQDNIRKSLVQFAPNKLNPEMFDYYCDIIVKNTDDVFKSENVIRKARFLEPKKAISNFLNELKSEINLKLINNDLVIDIDVVSMLNKHKLNIKDVVKKVNDDFINTLISYQTGKTLTVNREDIYVRKPSEESSCYSMRTLFRDQGDDNMPESIRLIEDRLKNPLDILFSYGNKFSLLMQRDKQKSLAIIKKLNRSLLRKCALTDISELGNLKRMSEILANEGINISFDPPSISFLSMIDQDNLKFKENFFIRENMKFKSFDLIKPKIYPEVKNFESQLFNHTHIKTNTLGGILISKKIKHDLKFSDISSYELRIRLKRKVLYQFYKKLKVRIGKFNFRTCMLTINHTHGENDNTICFCRKIFEFQSEEGITVINHSEVMKVADEVDSEMSSNLTFYLENDIGYKFEEFRKKGRLVGGEIIMCSDADDHDLFDVNYTVPKRTNQIVNIMNFLERLCARQIENSNLVDSSNLKDNVNLYRTLRCVMESDDRFERNLDLGIGFSDDDILKKEAFMCDVNCNFKQETMKELNSNHLSEMNIVRQYSIFLKDHFSFERDEGYRTHIAKIKDLRFRPFKEDVIQKMKFEISTLSDELEKKKKELTLMQEKGSDFISRSVLEDQLSIEREKIRSEIRSEFLIESIEMKSRLDKLTVRVKKKEESIAIYEEKIETLLEECDRLKSINLSLSEELSQTKRELEDVKEELSNKNLNVVVKDSSDLMIEESIIYKIQFNDDSLMNSKGFVYCGTNTESGFNSDSEVSRKKKKTQGSVMRARKKLKRTEAIRIEEANKMWFDHKEKERIKNSIFSKDEKERERLETLEMAWEDYVSPRKYKNWFPPYKEAKKDFYLPNRGETNGQSVLKFETDEDASNLSNHVKNIQYAFYKQLLDTYERYLTGTDKLTSRRDQLKAKEAEEKGEEYTPSRSLPFIFTVIMHMSSDSFLYNTGEEGIYDVTEVSEEIKRVLPILHGKLVNLLASIRYSPLNIPKIYEVKNLDMFNNQELKDKRIDSSLEGIVCPLKVKLKKTSDSFEEVRAVLQNFYDKFSIQRQQCWKVFRNKFFEHGAVPTERMHIWFEENVELLNFFRVINYVSKLLKGYLEFTDNLETALRSRHS
jgi:ubiquitin